MQHFSGSDKPKMLFFLLINVKIIVGILLINVKMPTIVGILTFMSRKIFMLSCVEHELFITSGPGKENGLYSRTTACCIFSLY